MNIYKLNIIIYNYSLQRPFRLIFTKIDIECNEKWAHIEGDIIRNPAGSTFIVGNFTIKKDIMDPVLVIKNIPLYSINMKFNSNCFLFQGKYILVSLCIYINITGIDIEYYYYFKILQIQ